MSAHRSRGASLRKARHTGTTNQVQGTPDARARQKNTPRTHTHTRVPSLPFRLPLCPPGSPVVIVVVVSSPTPLRVSICSPQNHTHAHTRTHESIRHHTTPFPASRRQKSLLPSPPWPLLKHPRGDGSPSRPLARQRDRGCGWVRGWDSSGGGRGCCSSPSLPRPSPSPSPWKPPRATLIRSTGTRSSLPPSSAAWPRSRSHGWLVLCVVVVPSALKWGTLALRSGAWGHYDRSPVMPCAML
jgi:hypothetical protein